MDSVGYGNESTAKHAVGSNPPETRKGRPKQTSKRTVLEEVVKCGKIRSEVKRLEENKVR